MNDNDINFDDGIWVKYSYQSEDEADCDEYPEYERHMIHFKDIILVGVLLGILRWLEIRFVVLMIIFNRKI